MLSIRRGLPTRAAMSSRASCPGTGLAEVGVGESQVVEVDAATSSHDAAGRGEHGVRAVGRRRGARPEGAAETPVACSRSSGER